ncbi:aminotransferase [Gluconacetobacter johannae DSM 13595]|uniref:Probable branched-chain-amino-acid aminotransferase n=1 Tax=Gluconacetobacter johannae TaxID=112140 RepID=A0A7W4J9U7_9PROT|nr:aminotransferase class IV [Gluconacetobacter johannae]MBB2177337.1 2-keto-4-methylthiobutyrate aminotransferase [Gluconacetobacter johannae]GBQ81731.1 aminotransferase [Gluconacetobacter johannae DSM 13595]
MTWLWLNDGLVSADAACIAPGDRGLTLGDGVFETMRVAQGRIGHLARHLDRLRQGAEILMFPQPDLDRIEDVLRRVVRHNDMMDGSLRLTLTRGCGPRGVMPPVQPSPTLLVTAAPPPSAPLPPANMIVSTQVRRDEASPLSRIKSLNYLPNVLARLEAARQGGDEALMLNLAGRVAEASASTIVIHRQGRLVTPPVAEGALPGIARAVLLAAGMLDEAPLDLDDLRHAEGVFLTSSLSVREVASLDGVALARMAGMADAIRACVYA